MNSSSITPNTSQDIEHMVSMKSMELSTLLIVSDFTSSDSAEVIHVSENAIPDAADGFHSFDVLASNSADYLSSVLKTDSGKTSIVTVFVSQDIVSSTTLDESYLHWSFSGTDWEERKQVHPSGIRDPNVDESPILMENVGVNANGNTIVNPPDQLPQATTIFEDVSFTNSSMKNTENIGGNVGISSTESISHALNSFGPAISETSPALSTTVSHLTSFREPESTKLSESETQIYISSSTTDVNYQTTTLMSPSSSPFMDASGSHVMTKKQASVVAGTVLGSVCFSFIAFLWARYRKKRRVGFSYSVNKPIKVYDPNRSYFSLDS